MPTVYNKVTINGTPYIDLSQDTVADASHIRQGYTGHLNDGTQVTGTYAGSSPNLQAKTNIAPTTSSQTIQPDSGYDGLSSVQINAMPSGTVTAPSTISGTSATVSTGTNTLTLTKSVSVTPTVSTAGYVSSGTAGNSSVSLTASVTTKAAATITPSTSNQTIAAGTYLTGAQTISGDANLIAANIAQGVTIFGVQGTHAGGGSGKNTQVAHGTKRVAATAYTDVGYEITVAKTGTYNVHWVGWRSSTSGTNGAQLYVNGQESGTAVTSFDATWTNVQNGSRTSVSLTQGDKVTLRARSRNTSYYMYIFYLSIEEA